MTEPNLDEQLHKILCHYIGNYVTADEYESDVKEAEQAIKALIAQQVKEAVDYEKSLRAKAITEATKDGIRDGLQMALYGTQDGSKEEKFIRHFLYSESIGDDK